MTEFVVDREDFAPERGLGRDGLLLAADAVVGASVDLTERTGGSTSSVDDSQRAWQEWRSRFSTGRVCVGVEEWHTKSLNAATLVDNGFCVTSCNEEQVLACFSLHDGVVVQPWHISQPFSKQVCFGSPAHSCPKTISKRKDGGRRARHRHQHQHHHQHQHQD